MTFKTQSNDGGAVDDCLKYWSNREMQLVRLHEEIISRRESLLNCSVAYHQSQARRSRTEAGNAQEAYLRNHKLLQDIRTSRVKMFDALNAPPTPRFMTLQKNYWAMVKSQVPMWEEDIGMSHPNTSRSAPAARGGYSARSQPASSRSDRPSPPKTTAKRRSKKRGGKAY